MTVSYGPVTYSKHYSEEIFIAVLVAPVQLMGVK